MNMSTACALLLAICLSCMSLAADTPPVFSTKPVATLLAEAKAVKDTDKVLLIKATAAWCGTCKAMDKTTWVDANVVAWFREHGTAVRLDTDQETDLARQFNIITLPTMIALKNGEEFDRVVGYRSADDLLAWLNGVHEGKRAADEMEAVLNKAKQGGVDMQTRHRNATALAIVGKHQKSLDEYLWLWENMVKAEPATYGVRRSFLANDMQQLAWDYPPAMVAFTKLRDDLETTLKTDNRTMEMLSDWVVLNEVVGDQLRTLAWFDRVKTDPDAKSSLRRESHRLQQLLIDRNRLADLAILIDNPEREVRRQLELSVWGEDHFPPGLDEETKQTTRMVLIAGLAQRVAPIYAAMLLADRNDDATKVLTLVSDKDETGDLRVALISAALDAGKANDAMNAALQAAKEKGASTDAVQQRLDAALTTQPK